MADLLTPLASGQNIPIRSNSDERNNSDLHRARGLACKWHVGEKEKQRDSRDEEGGRGEGNRIAVENPRRAVARLPKRRYWTDGLLKDKPPLAIAKGWKGRERLWCTTVNEVPRS